MHIILIHCTKFSHTSNIMFHSFHNNSIGFQYVQPLKHMWPVHFKSPQLVAVGEVTDIHKVFSNHVCYNTQAKSKFQAMNFMYVTFQASRFLKWPQDFWKIRGPQPLCVHVMHPFRRTCKNNMKYFNMCVEYLLCLKY